MTDTERQDKRDDEQHDSFLDRLGWLYLAGHPRWHKENGVLWYGVGNPLMAWRAFEHCRRHGRSVPEWVFRYFDQVARVLRTADRPVRDARVVAAEALRLHGQGQFLEADDLLFRLDVAIQVEQRRRKNPRLSVNGACERVAKELNEEGRAVPKNTIRRWWEQFSK